MLPAMGCFPTSVSIVKTPTTRYVHIFSDQKKREAIPNQVFFQVLAFVFSFLLITKLSKPTVYSHQLLQVSNMNFMKYFYSCLACLQFLVYSFLLPRCPFLTYFPYCDYTYYNHLLKIVFEKYITIVFIFVEKLCREHRQFPFA